MHDIGVQQHCRCPDLTAPIDPHGHIAGLVDHQLQGMVGVFPVAAHRS
jgi:hypothetical protein